MATGGRGDLLAVIRQTLETTLQPENSVKTPGKPRRKAKRGIAANLQGRPTARPADIPLQDTVQPAKQQSTVKPANHLQDTVKSAYIPQDTVKPAKPSQDRGTPAKDGVKPANLTYPKDTVSPANPHDTVKPKSPHRGKPVYLPKDTVTPAVLQDTARPAYLPEDTVKPANLHETVKPAKPPQDRGKPDDLPKDTVKPADLQDTCPGRHAQPRRYTVKAPNAAKPPQDTPKPTQFPQCSVNTADAPKLPQSQDTGKPAQLPQDTVKAVVLPQDTVVKTAQNSKKKKKQKKQKKKSPTDTSTVQSPPAVMAAQKADVPHKRLSKIAGKSSLAPNQSRIKMSPAVCEKMAAQNADVLHKQSSKRAGKSSLASTQNIIEMLPTEILVKILSYLDVSSLEYISQVNKMFNQLANDDTIWQQLYLSEFGERRSWKPKGMDLMRVQDRPVGYWKRLYRTTAGNEVRMWKGELKHINIYTGLPTQTKCVLRKLCISWKLTVCDKQGKQGTFHDAQVHFSDSSVIVCWSEGHWPLFHYLSSIQVHGVTNRGPKRPGWQSLMAKFDLETVTRAPKVLGRDAIVKLVLLEPGLTVGIWRGQHNSIAFVMASFHFHKLVERSLLGTPLCPYSVPLVKPPFDDIDPEYGLHGYRLHICLHNTETQIMSGSFSHLFCRRAEIRHGFVRLSVINKGNIAQHTILSGNITLPWKCAVLEGAVENCCTLSLTLLDEFQNPFWCVSTPVAMDTKVKSPCYDYDGDHFRIEHRDSEGLVQMELVWMEEHKQYFLVYLALFLSLEKVNKHFGRNYFSSENV